MDLFTVTPDLWISNEQEYSSHLKELTDWTCIPSLNVNDVEELQHKKLVRFCGMVQDMFSPEYYYEKFETIDETTQTRSTKHGKYADLVRCESNETIDYESKNNVTSERQTLAMISVPALNDWVQNLEKEKSKLSYPTIPSVSCNNINKRILEMDPSFMDEPENVNQNKKLRPTANPSESTTSAKEASILHKHMLNFPLPERGGKMCHVNLYHDYDGIKLNDVLDVIGFLSLDEIEEDAMETDGHNPPPSLVPRIQCVTWRRVFHNNPLVKYNNSNSADVSWEKYNVAPQEGCVLMEPTKMQQLKKELHTALTQLFMGDAIAAEYFLYHLISKIYLRQEPAPIGKFTLNISRIPVSSIPDYGKQLYNFIQLLVPKSHYMPMTLENMNKIVATPKKNYDCDKIHSGLLQLSNHTCLVLDETKLSPGQLNEAGVRAVAAFSKTIKTQKVVYDFVYYQMEYDCDIPILILSEGKSFLPNDFHIPLRTDQVCVDTFYEITEAARHFLKPDLLNDIRMYLTVAQHSLCEMSDSLSEPIQNEFVRLRRTESITSDDLHSLLILTRLICLSEGKQVMDLESWERACHLEQERRIRVK